MISVKDQFVAKFDLGDFKDFIRKDNFVFFTIVEEAGNALPTFQLQFTLEKEDMLPYFNQGNVIEIALGKTEIELVNIRLRIVKPEYTRAGQKRSVTLLGIYDALPYIAECKMKSYPSKSGVEVVKSIVGKHFKKLDFNVQVSKDVPMTWLQANVSDKTFVNTVWMRSYMPNSFLMTGITSSGSFVLRDLKTLLQRTPKYDWKLTEKPEQENDLPYNGDHRLISDSGITNFWMGYGRQKTTYDAISGEMSLLQQDLSPMMAMTKSLDRSNQIQKRIDTFGIKSGNVHSKYWDAYWQNLRNLVVFSSSRIEIVIINKFEPIRILDIVYFSETQNSNTSESSEFNAGLYIVSKVATTLMAQGLTTVLELNRESSNMLLGELK